MGCKLQSLVAAIVLISMGPANAADPSADNAMTVHRLLGDCKIALGDNPAANPNANYCLGYVSAVGDYLNAIGISDANSSPSICGNISYGAAIQAFVAWAEKHPEHWQEPQLYGVTLALRETWPCTKT